jgi:hypothetical protein
MGGGGPGEPVRRSDGARWRQWQNHGFGIRHGTVAFLPCSMSFGDRHSTRSLADVLGPLHGRANGRSSQRGRNGEGMAYSVGRSRQEGTGQTAYTAPSTLPCALLERGSLQGADFLQIAC